MCSNTSNQYLHECIYVGNYLLEEERRYFVLLRSCQPSEAAQTDMRSRMFIEN